jgi:hypothetical protein
MHGQYQYGERGVHGFEVFYQLKPVLIPQIKVDYDQIRMLALHKGHGPRAAGSFANNKKSFMRIYKLRQTLAENRVILDDRDVCYRHFYHTPGILEIHDTFVLTKLYKKWEDLRSRGSSQNITENPNYFLAAVP